ncbi:response regulator [Parasphingorhabdus flavimaris]|jgi:DNA-binding response OmpR family regulator|uniref:Response regulator n=1 Tax=Parasphingorhabdus flavimaris TaxID=266812 RepID=A0ABX2N2R0_9SPHN|nr:response regulator [Parasphingorhabdus flavimaris]NVD27983.1 response regulator [Parasphingorhabdus flavimaris]|tara:strand:- start:13984 stop:14364 length:381 start_codon:yes stop_codon:yes gene_type:complete
MAYILIADDDDILVDMIRLRLDGHGHHIEVAADGEAALDAVSSQRPDIIILDMMMPIISGSEVLSKLKSQPETRDIPVIMLTSRSGEADIVQALKAGVDDYLTKPFIPQELIARIDKLLLRYKNDG